MSDTQSPASQTQSSPHQMAVVLASAPFVFLSFSLPVYASDLGLGAVQLGMMYTAFTGTMLVLRPVIGWCLDRFGRRWFFTVAFVFYVAAMLAFAQGLDFWGLMFARMLQGVGASLMWVSVRTIIADTTTTGARGEAMGRLEAGSVRGSMIGAAWGFTLLGFMPMVDAWRIGFLGYAAIALFALLWSTLKVRETHHVPKSLPPLHLNAAMVRVFIIVFLSAFAGALIEPIYLLFLREKFELHPLLLAWAFLPAGLVFAFVPTYAGRWADRVGRRRVIVLGFVVAGLVSMALPWWPHILFISATYVLSAVGWAMASPAEEALVADLATPEARGRVIGAKEAAVGVGAALGPLVGGAVYQYASPHATFVANGVLMLCAAGLALYWLPRRQASHPVPPVDQS